MSVGDEMHQPPLPSSVVDFLSADPRPSFAVVLPAPAGPPGRQTASIVYRNPALTSDGTLVDAVSDSLCETQPDVWEWITKGQRQQTRQPHEQKLEQSGNAALSHSISFLHRYWTRTYIRQNYAIVSANAQVAQPTEQPPHRLRLDSRNVSDASSRSNSGGMVASGILVTGKTASGVMSSAETQTSISDLESSLLSRSNTEAAAGTTASATSTSWSLPTDRMPGQEPFLDVINSIEWDKTPLGPIATWHPLLQQNFNQILADSRPIAIYWGRPQPLDDQLGQREHGQSQHSHAMLYNEAFSRLCGARHPYLLGKTVDEAWAPESAARLKEVMRLTATRQRASVPDEEELHVFVQQRASNGYEEGLEETYLKWSIIPLLDQKRNEVLGFVHPVQETTSMRLWERRMQMLISLGEVLVTARGVKSYWRKAIEELGAVRPSYDIPLAIFYSVEEDTEAEASHSRYGCNKICRLEGSLGVPHGHVIAPATLQLRSSDEGLAEQFRKAVRSPHPIMLETRDGSLPRRLLTGLEWRGFGDPCRAAVILPIRPTREENVMGLLFLGLNPRRPFDNDYKQYISLLNQKLTTSLASTVLLEEEARRGRNAAEQAAYDQAVLEEKLAAQTKEATEVSRKFEAVAEFVPVGMCFGDNQGNIEFANDAWYRITGHPRGPVASDSFLACVLEEDQPTIIRAYNELQTSRSVTFEFRVKARPPSKTGAGRDGQSQPKDNNESPSFEKAGLDFYTIDPRLERHVLASAKAERAPDGTIIRVLTCLTDVTTHKQTAEEAVRRAQQAENLKRMAELATVGMYDMNLEGRLIGANNVFFDMCGLELVDLSEVVVRPWERCVVPEDLPILKRSLSRLLREGKPQTAEIRLKKPWSVVDTAGNKIVAPRWALATFMPVKSSDGVIQSFTGCLSDVSLQRWQLERETLRKEEAIESKRQQENFIDMTSHEMRNPLSAIVHCADAIIASLAKVQELMSTDQQQAATGQSSTQIERWSAEARQLIDNSIDSAETIVACAQHQKRIVDDILTMSKLDSKLLTVTPITVSPVATVREALKMFEVEARRVDIDLSMRVDPSYHELDIDFLDLDPSRLKQVLINLLTNALKFTKTGPTRNVTVTISASTKRPSDATSSVQFVPRADDMVANATSETPASDGNGRSDEECSSTDGNDSDSGKPTSYFLLFEVRDTGQGLSEDEKKTLFQRFVQASSRTHVKYGGSGLGLFISRRLTELQNGAIGVASLPGVGSTFAFYVEAHRPSEAALQEARAAAASPSGDAAAAPVVSDHLDARSIVANGNVLLSPTTAIASLVAERKRLQRQQQQEEEESPGVEGAATAMVNQKGETVAKSGDATGTSASTAATTPTTRTVTQPPVQKTRIRGPNRASHMAASHTSASSLADRDADGRPLITGVLVVEDNLINQQITRRGLQDRGFTVDVANHGLEALEKIAASTLGANESGSPAECADGVVAPGNNVNRPFPLSVILMDIEMPVQDGLTCTRRIRELERSGKIRGPHGRTPIIAVSANARNEQILEARAAGCDDVLVKPYRMPELVERMLIVSRKLRTEAEGGAAAAAVRETEDEAEKRQKQEKDAGIDEAGEETKVEQQQQQQQKTNTASNAAGPMSA